MKPAISPLAQLNDYIRSATAHKEQGELASARRFMRAWSSARTQDRVRHAATRKPANAGPLNSHVLVLKALAMMRELSPDYLAHFLVHVESLQWLEQESVKAPRKQGKEGAAGKRPKRQR